MFERRLLLPQRIIAFLVPALFGYLLAFFTLKKELPGVPLKISKDYGKLDMESIRRNTRSLLSLANEDSCECKTSFRSNSGLKVNYFGNSFVTNELYDDAVERRRERLAKWKKRQAKRSPIKDGTILYTTNIPVIFPYYGLELVPLGELSIPALRLLPLFGGEHYSTDANGNCLSLPDNAFCVNLYAHYGALLFDYATPEVSIKYDPGTLKKSVTLIAPDLHSINQMLEKIKYKSIEYQPTGSTDVVTIRYGPHKAQIPISIRYEPQPVLIDPKSGGLTDMVTVCIKTFERYPCLTRLINSIRTFYPEIRIIVADDSINFKEINMDKVDQFRMPAAIGFNNGKNLAISQVTTEYLVWVDDDFVFTEQTDLAWMLRVLESTDLDLVGGKAGSSRWGYTSMIDRLKGGSDGDCLYRTFGSRGKVAGFPTCQVADVIQNFYMARVLPLRSVGFDGIFKRISHKEFFLDALGKIKIGYCSSVSVGHNHSCLATVQQLNHYTKYREPNEAELSFIDQSWFYRSNLKCISEKKMYGQNKFFNLTTAATLTAKTGNL